VEYLSDIPSCGSRKPLLIEEGFREGMLEKWAMFAGEGILIHGVYLKFK
jgi:hypothetical protein